MAFARTVNVDITITEKDVQLAFNFDQVASKFQVTGPNAANVSGKLKPKAPPREKRDPGPFLRA